MAALGKHHIDELWAAAANIVRIMESADRRELLRRWNEWTPGHISARSTEPSNVPSRPVDINGERVTVPPLTDPTGDTATGRPADTPDYGGIVRSFIAEARRLEVALAHGTRPSTPSAEDLASTDTADQVRPGAGTCEICEHRCTGLRNDRIVRKEGHELCRSHHRGALRALERGQTVQGYIASTRALYGRDLGAAS